MRRGKFNPMTKPAFNFSRVGVWILPANFFTGDIA
jgi:hypothetical protein